MRHQKAALHHAYHAACDVQCARRASACTQKKAITGELTNWWWEAAVGDTQEYEPPQLSGVAERILDWVRGRQDRVGGGVDASRSTPIQDLVELEEDAESEGRGDLCRVRSGEGRQSHCLRSDR